MFHAECICWKIFEQIGIGMAYLHVFFNYNAWNRYSCRDVFRTLSNIHVWAFFTKVVTALRKKGSILNGIVLYMPCSYRDFLYYNKNETRALHSSEVQV